jgi:hypothetical protein
LDNVYLAAANTSDANDALVVAGPSLEDLRPVRHRTLSGPNEQVITEGVSLGDVAILVGYTGATGSSEAAVWRYADGALRPVRLPAEAKGGRPSAYVNDVLSTDDGFVAVGLAGQGPTLWTSDDFATWDALGLPGRSARVTAADARSLSRLPAGGAVAVGALIRPLGADAGVWVRVGTKRWRLVKDPVFRIGGRSEYGSLEPRAVAANGRAVVIAATAYVDGREEARPLVGSADGRAWSVAVGTDRVPLNENDRFVGRTPYPAFRAPENGSVEMNAVTPAGTGFVIGGSRGEPGRGTRAVVWRSRDGSVWSDPSRLPMPRGYRSATLTGFARMGDTLVGTGEVRKGLADTDTGWATWMSRDDGRTWRLGEIVARRQGHAYQLLPIPGGLLALGSVGPDSDLDAAAWTTRDGRRWQPVELGVGRTSGPGRQTFVSGVVDGDRLLLVGTDTPPQSGGSYVASTDIPVP